MLPAALVPVIRVCGEKNTAMALSAVLAIAVLCSTVADLDTVHLNIYVTEVELGWVRLGQKAAIGIDSYPGRVFAGAVVFISPEAEFTPKTIETAEERVKLVYRIKVDIPNPARELKPGMPADGEIEMQGAGSGL